MTTPPPFHHPRPPTAQTPRRWVHAVVTLTYPDGQTMELTARVREDDVTVTAEATDGHPIIPGDPLGERWPPAERYSLALGRLWRPDEGHHDQDGYHLEMRPPPAETATAVDVPAVLRAVREALSDAHARGLTDPLEVRVAPDVARSLAAWAKQRDAKRRADAPWTLADAVAPTLDPEGPSKMWGHPVVPDDDLPPGTWTIGRPRPQGPRP